MMAMGKTALYYDDYVLSIQYFNQVINAKPYLYEPYFFRAVAKLSLEDYRGAEQDCNSSISRNPFVVNSYQVRDFLLSTRTGSPKLPMISEKVFRLIRRTVRSGIT